MFSRITARTAAVSPRRVLRGSVVAWMLAAITLVGVATLGHAQTASQKQDVPARTLTAIDVTPLSDGHVIVRLHLSAPPPKPQSFTIDSPARLSVDLPDTGVAQAVRYHKYDVGVLRAIAAVNAQGRTRVVLDLTRVVPQHISTQGNDVLINLSAGGAPAVQEVPVVAAATAPTAAATTAPMAIQHRVESVHFHRGQDGQGRIIVGLSDAQVQVNVHQKDGKIIARFHDTTVPNDLTKRLDVLDFATPVRYIDTLRDSNDTEIVVTPVNNGNFEQVAYQTDNTFTIELQPLTQQEAEERQREHPTYTGKKISLDFQKVDVRALLQIIADVAGTNMVVSDSVKGQIAIRLNDVPWDQALAIILRTKGLGMRRQGNVMFIAPLAELAQREKVKLEAAQQKTKLAPLHSEIIQVNYAKASDIAAILKSGQHSILGTRGQVSVDPRTNTLLVLDTLDKLAEIRDLIQRLDVPVRQVLIQARIVIAQNNFDRQIGTQFGVTALSHIGNHGLVTTSGTNTATSEMIGNFYNTGTPGIPGLGTTGSGSTGTTTLNPRYNVNLPLNSAPFGTIGLAILSSNVLVDLQLSALQAEGISEVLSNPRVITANGKEASIEKGVEIPYQQSTSSGATSVSFKKAVMSMNVTPQITPDGRIIMDLEVHKDSVGEFVPTSNGGSVPSINTAKVATQVLVNDGQTVVLGGIYEDNKVDTVHKIPLLGDIPILGALFRFTEHQNNRQELLVFITPKIINQALTLDGTNY